MDHVIFLESFTYSYPPFPHTAHTIVPLKHSVLELSLGFLLQLFPNQSGKLLFVLNAERDNNTLSSSINTLVRAIVKRHRLALLPLPCKKGTSGSVIWWETRGSSSPCHREVVRPRWCSVQSDLTQDRLTLTLGWAGLPWPSAETKNSHSGFILKDRAEHLWLKWNSYKSNIIAKMVTLFLFIYMEIQVPYFDTVDKVLVTEHKQIWLLYTFLGLSKHSWYLNGLKQTLLWYCDFKGSSQPNYKK